VEVQTPEHVARIVRVALQDHGILPTSTSVAGASGGWDVTVCWASARVRRIHLERGSPTMLRGQVIRELKL